MQRAEVEHPEAAGPPVAAAVDVGAVPDEQVDHCEIAALDGE